MGPGFAAETNASVSILAQALSRVRLFATPWTAARQASHIISTLTFWPRNIWMFTPRGVNAADRCLCFSWDQDFPPIELHGRRRNSLCFQGRSDRECGRRCGPLSSSTLLSEWTLGGLPAFAAVTRAVFPGGGTELFCSGHSSQILPRLVTWVAGLKVAQLLPRPCCYCSVAKSRPTAVSWTVERQAPLSSTTSWSLLKFTSVESVLLSNHLIFCYRLLLLPSVFSSIRVFSSESALPIR